MKKYVYLLLAISLCLSCEVSDDEEISTEIDAIEQLTISNIQKDSENDEATRRSFGQTLTDIVDISKYVIPAYNNRPETPIYYTGQYFIIYDKDLSIEEINKIRLEWFYKLNDQGILLNYAVYDYSSLTYNRVTKEYQEKWYVNPVPGYGIPGVVIAGLGSAPKKGCDLPEDCRQ